MLPRQSTTKVSKLLFIEARGKDKIEPKEDPNHVVSAERDLFVKPEN
jgi:hypothetical protein